MGLSLIPLGLLPYPVQEEHQPKLIGFVNILDLQNLWSTPEETRIKN